MKTKLLSVTLFLSLIMGIGGCEDKEQKPEEKILGKWVIESTGMTEDKMFPYDPYGVNDDHFDFLSDKTVWHYCGTCVGEKYFQAATYKIDSEHFYWYTKDSDAPEAYYYSFYNDKLKITSVYPRTPGLEDVNITNIIVYKRIK